MEGVNVPLHEEAIPPIILLSRLFYACLIMPTPVSTFDYFLPEELIAQHPAEPRDSSRLLVLERFSGVRKHQVFTDILDELKAGDVLVFNATKVFRARLVSEDGKIEVFVLRIGEGEVEALVRPGKKFPVGSTIALFAHAFEIIEKQEDGVVRIKTNLSAEDMFAFCEKHGEIPTPPYVESKNISDEQYQTVYAKEIGSVAAPTAGLHFTPELLQRIRAKGVQIEEVILHVGIGTFRPVQSEFIEDHVMHAEMVELRKDVAERLRQAKQEGRRIIAVGTTTTRLLEGIATTQGSLIAYAGNLNVFITPGYAFKVIDGLITNFHLPKSTLLMLVSAFASKEYVLAAYKEAVEQRYRFFSFGDAMLIV